MSRTRTAALGVALAGAAAVGATALWPQMAGAGNGGLEAATTIAEEYVDERSATAAGYRRTDDCVDWKHAKRIAPKGSYMGYHYVDPTRMDTRLEKDHPEVVLYKQDASGKRVLTGIEYVVVDADQNLSTDGDRPSLWGHQFDGPMPGHGDGMPIHYDLHIWTHDDNPAGAWSAWNTSPDLSCP